MLGMIRKLIVAAALLVAMAGCRKVAEWSKASGKRVVTTSVGQPTDMKGKKVNVTIQPTPEGFLDRSFIGSEVGPDGAVSSEKQSFIEGEPIYVTMRFNLSPPHLQASLRVEDDKGKELHRDSKVLNGEKVVTFKVPPQTVAKPGTYRLLGFWGGNDACDYKIDVRGKRK